ncbi:MAG: sigma-54-dependent transcriptional regulator [Bryobacteraceae bacterium]
MDTVLIAEDEPEVRNYLALALTCHGYKVELAQDGDEAVGYLQKADREVSLLLLDLIMPRKDGFETLQLVKRSWPHLPIITLSGSCTPAHVAAVMKGGASDFLAKPIAHDDLLRAIQSALASARGQNRAVLRDSGAAANPPPPGPGSWSQRVKSILGHMAASEAPVLLRGETGVGKEVLARQFHAHSRRAERPFLKLNCAALPSELVESELFGYEKGAFTGAYKTTPGKFEMADKGTILLDEIGDMDFRLQAKLLQVLQDREFIRLGAKESSRVDVRVMAATHCDLERAIQAKRFREDLYYRLNIVEINVPPLRERKDEIPTLAKTFLEKYAPVNTPEVPGRLLRALFDHDWPGNVRELENVIRRYLIFESVDVIVDELKRKAPVRPIPISGETHSAAREAHSTAEHNGDVPPRYDSMTQDDYALPSRRSLPLRQSSTLAQLEQANKEAETQAILKALNATLWNRKRAAKLLNVDYKALLYKMKKLGIGEQVSDDAKADMRLE